MNVSFTPSVQTLRILAFKDICVKLHLNAYARIIQTGKESAYYKLRCLSASNRIIDVATDTFKDSVLPIIGIFTLWVLSSIIFV